ncbi:MAG: peptide-methionine (S)-S-oxide reductase MsrA [Oligoflexia bacterium]|nr:peptide-methionine (S)-S-oxide reductase MsrA [Oligoflexia bacterium]
MSEDIQTIVLGGGCFWCVEAVFQLFKGVEQVESGYAGGRTVNPTYEEISEGRTGHAEVIKVSYDPKIISLQQILTIFFHAHDPTTLNRQGNDKGEQYRSIILYKNEAERQAAESIKNEIAKSGLWGGKELVTQLEPLTEFYSAEDYHQNYYNNNRSKPYCSIVIGPKIKKIREEFGALLKN